MQNMQVKHFTNWLNETQAPAKTYTKKLSDLNPQRKYVGDTYNTDLFLRFKHLGSIRERHGKRLSVEKWFEVAQAEDKGFYSAVLADQMGQPDVRELWRDMMGRNASKVKGQVSFKDPFKGSEDTEDEVRDLSLSESLEEPLTMPSNLDPEWTLIITYPNDSLYSKANPYFEKLGIAFADLNSKTIYFDGAEVSEAYFTKDHMVAVEAHEIGHQIANHLGEPYYSKRQEQEADWLGINLLIQNNLVKAGNLLAERFSQHYGMPYTDLAGSEPLMEMLEDYLADK
jgi:hypothetical protein